MSITKNKKGFTLVELLAVIVILALIMSIAIVSMTGIMENARYSTFNDTARSIISGVRSQLLAANELRAGDYYFTESVLQNTGNLPFGGKIKFAQASGTEIGTGIYRASSTTTACTQEGDSFVRVSQDGDGKYTFSICIGVDKGTETSTAGYKWMDVTKASEEELQKDTKKGIEEFTTSSNNNNG